MAKAMFKRRAPPQAPLLLCTKRLTSWFCLLVWSFLADYSDRFSGSFYLSKTYDWAYIVRGFPMEGFQRVGHFLSADERVELLDSEFCIPGVVDAWWIGYSNKSILRFASAVATGEPRFLGQDGAF